MLLLHGGKYKGQRNKIRVFSLFDFETGSPCVWPSLIWKSGALLTVSRAVVVLPAWTVIPSLSFLSAPYLFSLFFISFFGGGGHSSYSCSDVGVCSAFEWFCTLPMQVDHFESALGGSMVVPWRFPCFSESLFVFDGVAIYPMPAGFLHQTKLLD